MSYTLEIENEEFTVVAECGDSGGYDWWVGAVLRDSTGALYWLEESGDSYTERSDLEPLKHWTDAIKKAEEASFGTTTVAEFAEELNREMRA